MTTPRQRSVTANGATPALVDLYDRSAVVKLFNDTDGAVHTASPGDETSAKLDSAVVDAAVEAFGANEKPYAHISGLWVFGPNTSITEESPYNAPAMVAWKEAIDQRILGEPGMRGILIVSGTAYGDGGGGIPGILLGSPRDADGNLIMLGAGRQHWATVHVADLAAVFRSALENDSARGRYVIGNGLTPTVSELTEAAAVAVGAPERSQGPTRRRVRGSGIISPRYFCSTRQRKRPRPVRCWAGNPLTLDSLKNFAAAATGAKPTI